MKRDLIATADSLENMVIAVTDRGFTGSYGKDTWDTTGR